MTLLGYCHFDGSAKTVGCFPSKFKVPMLHDFVHQYLLSWRALDIFGVALATFAVGVMARYLTMLDRFKASRKATKAERREAHFECLRTGPDLCILGLGTFLALCAVAIHDGPPQIAVHLGTLQSYVVQVQVGLLLVSIFLTGKYDSVEHTYWKGIIWPLLVGWLSVFISASLFVFLKLQGD
jgi:hypothetical protein